MPKGDKHRRQTEEGHLASKTYILGVFDPVETNEIVIGEDFASIEKKKGLISPAINHMFREIVTNAYDQAVATRGLKGNNKTTEIDIEFKDGTITVYNNGKSIPIEKTELVTETGETFEIYVPEAIFTKTRFGGNHDAGRISGGVNGVGATAVRSNSNLVVKICDGKKYYKQIFRTNFTKGHGEVTDKNFSFDQTEPSIRKAKSSDKRGTIVEFTPIYERSDDIIKKQSEVFEMMDAIFRTEIMMAAPYVGIEVSYNGHKIKVKTLTDLANILCPDDLQTTVSLKPKDCHPWEVVVSFGNNRRQFSQMTMFNGISVSDGGSHINRYKSQIQDYIISRASSKYQKELTKAEAINHFHIFVCGVVVDPKFDSQTKTKIVMDKKSVEKYELSDKTLDTLWQIYEANSDKLHKVEKVRLRNPMTIDKYTPAKHAGKRGKNCMLFLPEGDSAMAMIKRGIQSKETPVNPDFCGILSLGGVVVNPRKGGSKAAKMRAKDSKGPPPISKKFRDNQKLNDLLFQVLHLNLGITYEYEDDFLKLPYKMIIVTVDQDLDGVGNIFGLILNIFHYFWPELLRRGFVKRFTTPVIRAYPSATKNMVKSFYSDAEYKQWSEKNPNFRGSIKYYKGLATHKAPEVIAMFKQFHNLLYTYKAKDDDRACELFVKLYDDDTDYRKEFLRVPREDDYIENSGDSGTVAVEDALMGPTLDYHFDNVKRKLPDVIDGHVESQRKIHAGGKKVFGSNGNKPRKVFQFGGNVASDMQYHHGDAALYKGIQSMAKNFQGTNVLPLFRALGEFGSRIEGTKVCGSARYVETALNKRLEEALFPSADNGNLEYDLIDGEIAEPRRFYPIIAYAIAQNRKQPATGWAIQIYARSVMSLIKLTKKMITGKKLTEEDQNIRPETYGYNGYYVSDGKRIMTVGTYELFDAGDKVRCHYGKKEYVKLSNPIIRVTELPHRVWSSAFIESLKEETEESKTKNTGKKVKKEKRDFKYRDGIISAHDYTDADTEEVCIEVEIDKKVMKRLKAELKEGDFSEAPQKDPVISFLKLKSPVNHQINMVTPDKCVREFSSYFEVQEIWFEERRRMYIRRVERQIVLLELKIEYYQNLIRFTKNHKKYKITEVSDEEADSVLAHHKYTMIYETKLNNPAFIKTEDLRRVIMESDKISYDYVMNLSSRKMNDKSLKNYEKNLKQCQDQLNDLLTRKEPFKGATQWLEELDILADVIKEGRKTNWSFGKEHTVFE
jgi:DNA topoisomerase-2